jgi:hypothetical protein
MKRVNKLGGSRNTIAHSPFAPHGPSRWLTVGDLFTEEMDGGWDFKPEPITENEIKVLAAACDKLSDDILLFVVDAARKVHTSPRKHREQRKNPSQ